MVEVASTVECQHSLCAKKQIRKMARADLKSYNHFGSTPDARKLLVKYSMHEQEKRTNESAEMLCFATRWHQLGFGLGVNHPHLSLMMPEKSPRLRSAYY